MRGFYRIIEKIVDHVFIEDLDCGKSVTNDAERVVLELIRCGYGRHRIIYKDSIGEWAELVHDGTRFTGFAPYAGHLPEGYYRE